MNSAGAPINRYDSADLQEAVRVLKEGGVILYPTDTVWGIGCDAANEEAVKRIFRIKRREDAKAMLCLIDAPGRLQAYVEDIPSAAWDLLEVAVKPLTIIYPDARNVAPSLLAEDGSLGIRVTSEPFSQALCRALKRPVVSTSANISGSPAPRSFAEISDEIRTAVDYVVRFRQEESLCPAPSSIIKLGKENLVKVIR